MNTIQPFHIAIPVHDLKIAHAFYKNVLLCSEGRSDKKWVDLNLYGHQLVIHETGQLQNTDFNNAVDGHDVPIPHYGVVLKWDDWNTLAKRLEENGVVFLIEPYIRFEGLPGEQATLFFLDPSGNALEFKSFRNIEQLFAT